MILLNDGTSVWIIAGKTEFGFTFTSTLETTMVAWRVSALLGSWHHRHWNSSSRQVYVQTRAFQRFLETGQLLPEVPCNQNISVLARWYLVGQRISWVDNINFHEMVPFHPKKCAQLGFSISPAISVRSLDLWNIGCIRSWELIFFSNLTSDFYICSHSNGMWNDSSWLLYVTLMKCCFSKVGFSKLVRVRQKI